MASHHSNKPRPAALALKQGAAEHCDDVDVDTEAYRESSRSCCSSCCNSPDDHRDSHAAVKTHLEGMASPNKKVSFEGEGLHPSIASGSVSLPAMDPSTSAGDRVQVASTKPSSRSSSRTRAAADGQNASDAAGGSLAPQSISLPRSAGSSNIPLPSPSAVHINQSLEDSLRRGEEERLRRTAERKERRRRKLQQSKQTQGRQIAGPSAGTVPPSTVAAGRSPATTIADKVHLEDLSEADHSTDAVDEDDSALIVSPVIPDGPSSTGDWPAIGGLAPPLEVLEGAEDDVEEEDGFDEGEEEDYDSDYEDLDGRSLTRQLAETAVSVREMSRELGRARVKSNIQSVLIVTKARDNQLIKLTREIALYLMKTPRYGRNRGLIVYVDAQLKKSKRFDAAGIERDNPELFRSNTHLHHHHHGHAHSHSQGTPSGSATPRRNSSRRASGHSQSASSLNLLGMTAANPSTASNSGSTTDRGYFSNQSGLSSGTSTPAQNGTKPMTKLTEALVNRQIDRQLEKESQRRQIAVSEGRPGHRVAFSTNTSQADLPSTGNATSATEEPQGLLRYWTAEMCSKSPHLFDLVVTLGGDGTVLFTSWLFQHVVPPVIPFALGSLGFLTNFDFSNYKAVLESAINDGVRVNLRMRFTATIYRAVENDDYDGEDVQRTRVMRSGDTGQIFLEKACEGGWQNLESGETRTGATSKSGSKDKELRCSVTRPVESFEVLNDLVVDRGPSPYVSLLELFGDENHMTTVQADGLCVATPTGSTAYSLSAGGSLVHPEIPTLLITPICPHTLSFRPMLLPDSMELRIVVPYNSRSTAWASFDGRGRVELRQGDHIKVTASTYPFPTVCADKQSTDWFQAITRTLKWNERQRQKSFVVVEQDRKEAPDALRSKAKAEKGNTIVTDPSAEAHDNADAAINATATLEEEEEDGFDIDDISSDATKAHAEASGDSKYRPNPANKAANPQGAHNERQSAPPTISLPGAGSLTRKDAPTGPLSPNEHEYSHSSAQHLRQYATYPSDHNGGGRSPRDRTPRTSELKTPTTRDWTPKGPAADSSDRGNARGRRSRRQNQDDHVKAFVVFGMDSSDAETSASEDA